MSRLASLLALFCLCSSSLFCTTGCLVTRVKWKQPKLAKPQHLHVLRLLDGCVEEELRRAEDLYQAGLKKGRHDLSACVDDFFEVARLTLPYTDFDTRACKLHKSALIKLVEEGQRFCRLDARTELVVFRGSDRLSVPIQHHGFSWELEDFRQLDTVGNYHTNAFKNTYRQDGMGIPLVVSGNGNRGRPFLTDTPVFGATLTMRDLADGRPSRAQARGDQGSDPAHQIVLNLYDPLQIEQAYVGSELRPLATDISAAMAFRLRGYRRTAFDNFLYPPTMDGESRLYMIEPYAAQKIPVIFIHGLLSDPFTWVEMVNELRSDPEFRRRFQVWVFEYPTGESFLNSAAELRRQIKQARRVLVQEGGQESTSDEMTNIVLVGHSMGGLLAKLQVTDSQDTLWRTVANKPFDEVIMDEELRQEIRESFFFKPLPEVSRVVYIGTPHHGSVYARRCLGRIGSALVTPSEESEAEHARLMANNPGVFSPEVSERIPTSIDMMEPGSPLLQSMSELPICKSVALHSIIGDGCWTIGHGPSDGVVPVESAIEPRAGSERYIGVTHNRLNKHRDAVDELRHLLAEHLATLSPPQAGTKGQVVP